MSGRVSITCIKITNRANNMKKSTLTPVHIVNLGNLPYRVRNFTNSSRLEWRHFSHSWKIFQIVLEPNLYYLQITNVCWIPMLFSIHLKKKQIIKGDTLWSFCQNPRIFFAVFNFGQIASMLTTETLKKKNITLKFYRIFFEL